MLICVSLVASNRNTLAMLADLGVDSLVVYEDDFENAFLERTREFYRQESLEYLAQNTCPDYLTKAEGAGLCPCLNMPCPSFFMFLSQVLSNENQSTST
jgi:hypothetical protein